MHIGLGDCAMLLSGLGLRGPGWIRAQDTKHKVTCPGALRGLHIARL